MRRTLLTSLMVLAVLWSAAPPAPAIEAATNLSGSITANTVLTQANSPYLVTGTVVVEPGVTLTVDPGVRVEFAALAGLEVRGTLTAQGTAASRIVFTGSTGGTGQTWSGVNINVPLGGRGSIAFADFSNATSAITIHCCVTSSPSATSGVTIADTIFQYNRTALASSAGAVTTVERTTFEDNDGFVVTGADWKITNSTFRNNYQALFDVERTEVTASTFTGHFVAIRAISGTFTGNTITNSSFPVQGFGNDLSMTFNTFADSLYPVQLMGPSGSSLVSRFEYNNLTSTGVYSFEALGNRDREIPNNWWGTTDLAQVRAKVLDGYHDASRGRVDVEPMLSGPVDIANHTVPPVLPTATPTQTPITPPSSTLSGSIFTDTTLRLANSPYLVTGDVVIFAGATLTIEPGVRVEFAPYKHLEVRGRLVAEGASASRIVIKGSAPVDGQTWHGFTFNTALGGHGSFAFVDFSNANDAIKIGCCTTSASVRVTDSTFRFNRNAFSGNGGPGMTFERLTFEDNVRGVAGADWKISHSTFRNNTHALFDVERTEVVSSTFTGNMVAIQALSGTFTGNTITNNGIPVDGQSSDLVMTYNTITGNQGGVQLVGPPGSNAVSAFQYNNLANNGVFSYQALGTGDRVVPNNWWGTTNTAQIEAAIFDGRDQSGMPRVNYLPMLSGPVDIVNRTAPAAVTPTLTPTVTPVPTGTPVPTMTPSPTPTPPGPATLSCNPRPKIDVETVRDGQNRLKVTLTANPAQTNGLASVTIGAATNAIVEAGQPAAAVTSTLPLTGKSVSTTFYIRRIDPNAATTVQLIVQDGCGEWKTFVGGGPGSF